MTVSIKYLTVAVLLSGLVACGGEQTLEQKKAVLGGKKVELAKLQNEIKLLEEDVIKADPAFAVEKETGIMVTLKNLVPEHFEHHFEVNGTIQALETANLSPEMGGQIKSLLVKEGDRVSAGTLLVILDANVIDKSLDELDNGLELAQTVYDRQARLWENNIGSEIQYLEAKNKLESLKRKKETLLAQKNMSMIRAPFSGIIDRLFKKEGELASPGMPVLTLVNMDEMKVMADVSENYVQSVKPHEEVELNFPSFGISLKAPIRTVSNIINPANRAFRVEVRVKNTDHVLKPNGIATLNIRDFEADDVMVVPAICIGKDSKGDYLFTVHDEDGKQIARKTYITAGRSSNGETMVTEGLSKGDRVIVEGYNELSDGDMIREAKPRS